MSEFVLDDYKLAGHLTPFYNYGSLLDHVDMVSNPYGFSSNPIDDKVFSYKTAKMVSRQYCEYYAQGKAAN